MAKRLKYTKDILTNMLNNNHNPNAINPKERTNYTNYEMSNYEI